MSSPSATSPMARSSSSVYTAPVGLPGELMMTIFVRGDMASSNSSAVIFQPFDSFVETITGSPPARRTISG